MATVLAERPQVKDPILMSVTEETITLMAGRFAALKINGIDDKAGFLAVDNARKECKKARGVIAAEHKELKADALKVCQTLDQLNRTLTGKVEAIENRLISEIDAVEAEKRRIQQEKDNAIYADRVAKLKEHGATIIEHSLRAMTPAQFAEALAQAIQDAAARKEQARIAAEQAEANRIESERLAKERAELDAQRLEQNRKAAELQAEQDRLAKAESDRLAAEDQKRREAAAAEQARIDTEARLKREAAVAEAERVANEAAAKREMELQPAKKKLNLFADSVLNLEIPSGISDFVENQVQIALNTAAETIRRIGANLS